MPTTYKYTATNNGYTATLSLTPGTQSIVDNTTVVAYKLELTAGSYYFQLWPIGWEIWLAGKQVAYQALRGAPQKSISPGGTITLVSGNTTITHNADGTKQASIGFRVDGGTDAVYLPGTVRFTGKDTLPLPTIPRASGLSLSASSVTLNGSDGSIGVTVSPHSDSFSHRVKYTIGSASNEISLAAGVKTGTLALPMSLLNQIPNNTSGAATVTLTTYSGSTALGSVTAQLTIVVGNSIVPTISSFTATRVGQSKFDMYVKGFDKARLRTTASGAYSSTIRTYEITGGLSGSDVVTAELYSAGTVSWTVKVTDSRGRTATAQTSVTVVDYTAPIISGASFERCTADGTPDFDGTSVRVTADITYSHLSGQNSYYAKVQYKLQTSDTWTDAGIFSTPSKTYALGLSDTAYDVRLTVTDQLSPASIASATLDIGDIIGEYDPDSKQLDLLPNIVNIVHAILVSSGLIRVPGDMDFSDTENNNKILQYVAESNTVKLGEAGTQITLAGETVSSVVVEAADNSGSGGWSYRKYSDGSFDMWGTVDVDVNITSAMGSLYRSGNVSFPDFPFTPTDTVCTPGFTPGSANYSALPWATSAWSGVKPPKYYLIRHNSVSGVDGELQLIVHGHWK